MLLGSEERHYETFRDILRHFKTLRDFLGHSETFRDILGHLIQKKQAQKIKSKKKTKDSLEEKFSSDIEANGKTVKINEIDNKIYE